MDNFLWLVVAILIGLVVVKVLRRRKPDIESFVACPYCREPISTAAKVCKSCHRSVEKELARR
jgi:hypothetical protein